MKTLRARTTSQARRSGQARRSARADKAGLARPAGQVIRGRILGSAIAVVLLGAVACSEPPTVPPVTLGELTLTRSELIPERYTLEVPMFNTGAAQLERYRISARARAGTDAATAGVAGSVAVAATPSVAASAAASVAGTVTAPTGSADTSAEEAPVEYPVELTVAQPLDARARSVQSVTFDCPLAVIPAQGLTLTEITFLDFHFSSGPTEGVIEYGYAVGETQ